MRKIFLFSPLILSFAFAVAQTKPLPADEIMKAAYEKAAKEKKNLLLIFHASWCGWCRKMDSSLQDAAVRPLIDKAYVVTHLTVYENRDKKALENLGSLDLLTKLGGADKGLPYWYLLDKEGKTLASSEYGPGKNCGCPASEEEVAYFIVVLKQRSSLNDEELNAIQKRFRKNDE